MTCFADPVRPDVIPPDRAVGRLRRLAALALLAASGAFAQPGLPEGCDIAWRITPRHDRVPRVLEVELSFPAGDRRETGLRPVPGFGGAEDYVQALGAWRSPDATVQVQGPAGTPPRVLVQHPSGGLVRVAYEARAALPDPDDGLPQAQEHLYRTQIGADWFQFLGHGVLPSLEPWGDDRTARWCVVIAQPGRPEAPAFGTHLHGRGPEVVGRFTGSHELLRHAFYAGGPSWRLAERTVPGGVLHTAVRGSFAMVDADFADQTAALVGQHRRFWGAEPSPPQWVVLTPNFQTGSYGGTLVHQAALLHAGAAFSPASGAFEFLVGHENLHQWIPDRFGSRAPDPDDALHYWFSEGFTNYYTHRLLLAAGLWTLPRYADALTQVLRSYWRSPARNATAADIAPRFFSDRDAGQQFYSRGELLAMRWDRALRERGHPGLDEVLKPLLLPQPLPSGTPLGSTRVLDAVGTALGALPRRDVAAHVDAGRTLPLDEGLAGPCFVLGWDETPRWRPGFDTASLKAGTLRGVDPSGPAHAAGARNGQQLVAGSVVFNDVARDIELTVRDTPVGPPRTLRFRPVDGSHQRLPTLRVNPATADGAACVAWQRRPLETPR